MASAPEKRSQPKAGLSLSPTLAGETARLFPILYKELRILAHSALRRESKGIAIRTTALVHEAYLKLSRRGGKSWKNRGHFLSTAAVAMRQILVDYFREAKRQKRGGGQKPQELHESDWVIEKDGLDILALDEALTRLTEMDPRKAQIVELRFFCGLTSEEIAKALGLSLGTVNRDWQTAKAWLHWQLTRGVRGGV